MVYFVRLYLILCSKIKDNGLVYKLIFRTLRPIVSRIRLHFKVDGVLFKLNPIGYIDSRLILNNGFDKEVKNLVERLSENDVFIDIGANFGLFSLLAAKKGALVVSFEPSTRELISFYHNLELNKDIAPKIRIIPMAVGKQVNDFLSLAYGPITNTGTNQIINGTNGDEKVPVVEVDKILGDYYLNRIKLIKIDVEGFELTVIESIQDLLSKLSNLYVICEINNDIPNANKIFEIFEYTGFELCNKSDLTNSVNNAIFYKKVL